MGGDCGRESEVGGFGGDGGVEFVRGGRGVVLDAAGAGEFGEWVWRRIGRRCRGSWWVGGGGFGVGRRFGGWRG